MASPSALTRAALAVSALWGACAAAYGAGWAMGAEGPPGAAALALIAAACGTIALCWFCVLAAQRLEAAAAAGRAALAQADPRAAQAEQRAVLERLDRIERALAALRQAPPPGAAEAAAHAHPTPQSRARPQAAAQPAPEPAAQPPLPLSDAHDPAPIGWADLARALNFPSDPDDTVTIAAIGRAIRDGEHAELLQAAEDVLTMLSAEGLHMEDLPPEHASAADWRAYAQGARGAAADAIGGVRDEAALERAAARLQSDPIFRDSCLVFARRWARLVSRMHREEGGPEAMLAVADSRSGRAFMLAARAMGAFDQPGAARPARARASA